MPLTIYDISKKANVSIATVSRVLNGSDNVRESTRKKVMDIMKEYDYTPNASARAMSLHSMQTVGILCADSSDIFLAKAVYYLQQDLQANGYESLLCCTGYNLDLRQHYMSLILSKKVDALILVGSNFIGSTEDENQYIMDGSSQVPIMLLNAAFDYPNVYSTLCDDSTSMTEATSAMLQSGIDDILYLYNSDSYSGMKKLHGFEFAMRSRRISGYEDLICKVDSGMTHIEDIASYIGEFEAKGHTFHGIIAADDTLAIAAVKYAQRTGRNVPDDLAIIGYNNSILTGCCTPELTSIDNFLETQTSQLVKTLIGVLSGEQMPKKTLFSCRLIKRGTTNF
jgi:LacI family transcriptional regulator/LacI family asc operon transcriptional repressor